MLGVSYVRLPRNHYIFIELKSSELTTSPEVLSGMS